MIGKLRGVIDSIEDNYLILDVSGVGYVINCSAKLLDKLPGVNQHASFLINMQVKEDDISLYGFIDKLEQIWFEYLITVQGIGPRLALTILSALEPNDLIAAIVKRSKESFKHISGVGPKLAERIFIELAKKANQYDYLETSSANNKDDNINDALVALTNLGYNRNEAYNICKIIGKQHPDITISELIKLSLKELSSS